MAILGTAHPHLADHLRVLAGHAEVCAVHPGRYPTGASRRLHELRDVPVAADAAAALVDAEFALVCSTTAEHRELIATAVRAGTPVLVEKPLAATATEAAASAHLVATAGGRVAVAMFLRCAPALRRAGEFLAEGRLGELVARDALFTHPGLLDGFFADAGAMWMLEPSWGGGSAFADLVVHLVDLLRWPRPEVPLRVRGALLRPPGGWAGGCRGHRTPGVGHGSHGSARRVGVSCRRRPPATGGDAGNASGGRWPPGSRSRGGDAHRDPPATCGG